MKLFNFKSNKTNVRQKDREETAAALQTAPRPYLRALSSYTSFSPCGEYELYRSLRDNIPVIDAALEKLVRLMGNFTIICPNKRIERDINEFFRTVNVGGKRNGIGQFVSVYMNQLLTYGTAIGEIVPDGAGRGVYALVNVPLENVELAFDDNLVDVLVCRPSVGKREPLPYQELLLVSALNPEPSRVCGVSLLHSLTFVSDILMKIYNTIGVNWERVGNVRFAVTYKPSGDSDRALSQSRARQIADEWSKAMSETDGVSDFVSVGDVSIKVIGADNQVLDSEVPVREMLEQIVAKLAVPPFLLGLSWSTTERMSSQQVDLLTSELEYYRRILDSVIGQIVRVWQQLNGVCESFEIKWDNINLQDEVELAKARLYNSQADALEREPAE